MTNPIEAHVAALREAQADEQAFREAVRTFFADAALDAADRKRVAAEVTGAPARRLSSDSARRDELERWAAAKARSAARSQDRMMETSRF